jgi:hypothetical protein
MKKKKYKIVLMITSAIVLFFIAFKPLRLALFSSVWSCLEPIDNEFVINEKEWKSESGSIIRFDNGESTLSNDTIYYFGAPEFIITKLNKHFNEMTVEHFKSNKRILYTSTREFTR